MGWSAALLQAVDCRPIITIIVLGFGSYVCGELVPFDCVTTVYSMSMPKLLPNQPGESEQPEAPEESYTPEQLEKGRRMMARIQQAAVLAAARLREKEALERLASSPPASRFIN
jgi:hypothetical protein